MDTKYNPEKIESKWYDYWLKNKFFHSKPNDKKPYTILIPPPNVTGILHMGHMLNNTIQDVLIRRARLLGFNTCWVPGTDHASIATEAKVIKKLNIDDDIVLSAFINSKDIRPQRVTILDKSTKEQIQEAVLATGVIS